MEAALRKRVTGFPRNPAAASNGRRAGLSSPECPGAGRDRTVPRAARCPEVGCDEPARIQSGGLAVHTVVVYTVTVLDGARGFDWDLHNAGHVARHGVAPAEVEETVERSHVIIPAKDMHSEKRWKLLGRSAAGRFLVVVFTIRDGRLRPVTAHTMNQRERRIYAPEIEKAV